MQGQFWKNFRRRGAGASDRARSARKSPRGAPRVRRRCRLTAFRLQSGRSGAARMAAARPDGALSGPSRTARHETGPSTTFGPHPPTMPDFAQTKPQVNGSPISRNPRYGRGVGVKRSRWAGFVAGASRTATEWSLIMSRSFACRRMLLSLKSKKARQHGWPSKKLGGPSGIRTQNPGIMSPLR